MLLGYARVSTDGQSLDVQRRVLTEAGCVKLFEEKASGARADRVELARLLDHVRDGDTIVVTRLDRLARSTADLLRVGNELKQAGAGLRSIAEPWADTTSPAGWMILTVFAGIAEFERSLILDRTRAGRDAALKRGVKFGRKTRLTPAQVATARQLIDAGSQSPREVAAVLQCHPATLYRALKAPADLLATAA